MGWLLECDELEWQNVDFSWPRTGRREEWTTPGVNAVIWRTPDGTRAAYTISVPASQAPASGLI